MILTVQSPTQGYIVDIEGQEAHYMRNIDLSELDALHQESERRQSRAIEALSGMAVRFDKGNIHPDDLNTITQTLATYGITGARVRESEAMPGVVVIEPALRSRDTHQERQNFGTRVHDMFSRLFTETPAVVGYCVATNEKKGSFDLGDPVGMTATGRLVNLRTWNKEHKTGAWEDFAGITRMLDEEIRKSLVDMAVKIAPDTTSNGEGLKYVSPSYSGGRPESLSDHDAAVLVHKVLNYYQDETAVSLVPEGFPELRRALKRAAKMVRSRDEAIKGLNDRAQTPAPMTRVLEWYGASEHIYRAINLSREPGADWDIPTSLRQHIAKVLEWKRSHDRTEEAMSTLAQNLTVALRQGINPYKSGSPLWTAVQQGLNWRKTAQESATKTLERVTQELRNVLQGKFADVNTYDEGTRPWRVLLLELESRLRNNSSQAIQAVCTSELHRTLRNERWAVSSEDVNGYRKPWYEALKATRLAIETHGQDQAKAVRDEMTAAVTKVLEGPWSFANTGSYKADLAAAVTKVLEGKV